MENAEKYVDFVLNEVVTGYLWIEHVKECDICINWCKSGNKSLYQLTCGEGWILVRNYGDSVEKAAKPDIFI